MRALNADQTNTRRPATGATATGAVTTNRLVMNMTIDKIRFPSCCGQPMKIKTDLGRFMEIHCEVCNDIIYLKKQDAAKPQMLDD